MADLTGKDIGRYHIVTHLGQGGMASVYKAFDTRLEREVAIKFIRKEAVSEEAIQLMLKRFEREAKALARLSHPNIVKVHDFGEYEGSPYLVMEYIRGGTLKDIKAKGVTPWQEAARLLAPVARALNYAHLNHIVHRDIKPSNILITESGEPMLSDFGIAKILDVQEHTQLTSTGTGVGTPDYMAPEQWMGKVVPQTDIYALGIVFFELVTGRLPFQADTPAAVLIKHVNDPLPRPRSINPDLPEAVEFVLYKALAKKPEDRYADMNAFASAMEKLSLGILTPLSAERPGGDNAAPSLSDTGTATQTAPTPPPPIGQTPQQASSYPATPAAAPAPQIQDGVTTTASVAAPQPIAKKKNSIWVILAVLGGLGIIGLAVVAVALLILKPFAPAAAQQQTSPTATRETAFTRTPSQGGATAIQEQPPASPSSDMLACLLVYGTIADQAINANLWQGMQRAKQDFFIDIDYAEVSSSEDGLGKVDELVARGCTMIFISSFFLAEAAEEGAVRYPEIQFVGIDLTPTSEHPNLSYVLFPEDEAGYMVGLLAGMLSESRQIFAICGMELIPPIWRYCEGFRAGALAQDSTIQVELVYYPGTDVSIIFNDPQWGYEMADAYFSKGFDTLFVVAGPTGDAALRRFAELHEQNPTRPTYGFGVDYDYYYAMPEAHSILLSSALKLYDQAVYDVIQKALAGQLPSGRFDGLAGYAPYHDLDSQVPDWAKQKMQELAQSFADGSLETGVPPQKP